ncbi:predicted protein [Thalassiosira pseudonana CCMP1335]|uniref:BZIP domain-containing protein n=1 Tax=Thalassiosira pseudonana TaxID=35128 RepID=B8BWB2_THAPS|nr:predicted protein [Thalassiosira pseudonana CCMP1335]EED94488.1 predicted protein [Thalassiosira pseudonana CCMP1335]
MTISVKFSTMEIKPMFVSSESSTDSGSETCDSFAIQPVVTVRKSKDAKRPQMKYDPAIPMTKEQTSAWRREQRRKRNRESAAACRKRQRDLISELEVEVDGWKAKFDDALAKLRQLEGDESAQMNAQDIEKMFPIRCSSPSCEGMASSSSSQDDMTLSPCMSFNLMQAQPNHVVSPYDNRSGCVVPPVTYSAETLDLPVLEETLIKTNKQANLNAQQHSFSRVEKRQHLTEIITRPANISRKPPFMLMSTDSLRCFYSSALFGTITQDQAIPPPKSLARVHGRILSPEDALHDTQPLRSHSCICPSLVTSTDSPADVGQAEEIVSESEESELGEFLADAAQWL